MMNDRNPRLLVAERMEFDFEMREIDKIGRVIRTVRVNMDCPDSITHSEVTESFQNFLTACGYVFTGEIRYIPRGEE